MGFHMMTTNTDALQTKEGDGINVSVVIPCYKSTESLIRLVERLRLVFTSAVMESYEIVLVDDGSPHQDTWSIIVELSNKYSEVRGLQLSRNFGKPSALLCGYSAAIGKWVIAMDDDLQHQPEDIPILLGQRQHDLVMGQFVTRKHALWQRMASNFKSWLDYKLLDKPRHVYLSPFHLIGRSAINAILAINTPTPHIGALMMHVTRDVVMVNVRHEKREIGKTTFTFIQRVRQFSNLLINNSSLLLNLVAKLGISLSLLSLLYGSYIAFRRIFSDAIVEGWTSLMVVTLGMGGILMFSLGVVGEYLLRIINGLENRPAYVVRKRSGKAGSTEDGTE